MSTWRDWIGPAFGVDLFAEWDSVTREHRLPYPYPIRLEEYDDGYAAEQSLAERGQHDPHGPHACAGDLPQVRQGHPNAHQTGAGGQHLPGARDPRPARRRDFLSRATRG